MKAEPAKRIEAERHGSLLDLSLTAVRSRPRLAGHLATIALLCLVHAMPGCGSAPKDGSVSAAVAGPKSVAVESEPWSFLGRPGKLMRTDHYRLYTTEENPVLLARLPLFMETAMEQYMSEFGVLRRPPMKLDTFVLGTRSDWEHLTRRLTGGRASTYLRIQRGGYAFNGTAVLFDIGTRDTMSIAAHEGWHQYTQRAFRERLPTWLEEGIGTYMEGHRWDASRPRFLGWANTERFDQLRAASASGMLMPLEAIVSSTPRDLLAGQVTDQDPTLTYYAQIWALVHFLREGEGERYRLGLERLILDAAEGRMATTIGARFGVSNARAATLTARGPIHLMTYIDEDLDRLSLEYEAFISRIVRPGTRGDIAAGRSPLRK